MNISKIVAGVIIIIIVIIVGVAFFLMLFRACEIPLLSSVG